MFQFPSVDYFDLDASYEFSAGCSKAELRVGVENLTDEDPPIFPSPSRPTPTRRNTTSSAAATTPASATPSEKPGSEPIYRE